MSRLYNYINEDVKQLNDVVSILKKDCKPFIKVLKESKKFLYRGSMDTKELNMWGEGIVIHKKKVRKDRKPKDMDIKTHKELNKLFHKKFGWKVRSEGLFCTGNINEAGGYGYEFLVFPIGEFKYVWSPEIRDLYSFIEEMKGEGLEYDLQKIVNSYKNKSMADGIKKKMEFSIKCDEYYMIYKFCVSEPKLLKLLIG